MCLDKRTYFSNWYLSILLLVTAVASAETGFLDKNIVLDKASYAYQVYIPKQYSTAKKWPIIVFLHGAGERGNNALLPTEVGLGSALRRAPEDFPTIAIFPQCPAEQWWSSQICEQIALHTLEQVQQQYATNPDRIYLSGLSMGGYGVWHLATKYQDRWAALYPIAGRVKPAQGNLPAPGSVPEQYAGEALYQKTAQAVKHLPIWIAHGAKDNVVPVSESQKMSHYLTKQGADVTYREYADEWHNVWDTAYADKESITWLFNQVKTLRGNVGAGQK